MAYGQIIPNLEIDNKPANYSVLNERDARAGAGIMMIIGIVAFIPALFLKQYAILTAVVVIFTIEFLIRVIDPHKAPLYALGRFFVKNQRPEWSGAVQKRFAWTLGLIMASTMIIVSIILGVRGPLPFAICSICLSLMWLESALGVCVGCKLYYGLMNLGLVKQPEALPACPGGMCPISKPKHKS